MLLAGMYGPHDATMGVGAGWTLELFWSFGRHSPYLALPRFGPDRKTKRTHTPPLLNLCHKQP
jgi:hypothetical protein